MPLPNAPPEGGGDSRRMHFAYVGTDDGDRWNAYLAGPAWWGWCHKSTRTKPCLDFLTGGALECPRCLAGKEPLMTGYVPVYRQADGAPRSVIVADVSREVIDPMKTHTRVLIGREMDATAAVWMVKAPDPRPLFQTMMKAKQNPADITSSLLTMWAIPELVAWYRALPVVSDNAVSVPEGVAVKGDGSPYSPMMQAAAKRNGALVVSDPDIQAEYDAMRKKLENRIADLGKPHANGKPKPR